MADMAQAKSSFALGGKQYTLAQLKKIPPEEMRKLIGKPQTPTELAHARSKQIKTQVAPSVKAPTTVSPLRVRAEAAPSAAPKAAPAPGIKPSAPPSVPAPPLTAELLEEPPKTPGPPTELARQQATALRYGTESPRDKALVEKMRKGVEPGIIRRAWDELATPGTRGMALAKLIVAAAKDNDDIVPILDAVSTTQVIGGANIRRIALAQRKKRGISPKESIAEAMRIANAFVTVGEWPRGFIDVPEHLDPKKQTVGEQIGGALKPQVEIMGFNSRARTIVPRAEGTVGYLFRMADLPQSAVSGAIIGLTDGKSGQELLTEVVAGIREGKILYDAADKIATTAEWAKDNPRAQMALRRFGIGLTITAPDAFMGLGFVRRGAKLAARLPDVMAARETEKIGAHLEAATAHLDAGRRVEAFEELDKAGKIEAKQRKKNPPLRDAVSIEEAKAVEKQLDAGDPNRIGDEELAKSLPGQSGENLISMHPATRRHKTDVLTPEGGTTPTQDFRTLFDFREALKELYAEAARLETVISAHVLDFQQELARKHTTLAELRRRAKARGRSQEGDFDQLSIIEALEAMENSRLWKVGDTPPTVSGDLDRVQAAIRAVKENIKIRTAATKTVVASIRGEAPGLAFRTTEAERTPRAVDAIAAEADSVGVSINTAKIEADLKATGEAIIPDVEDILRLRRKIDDLNRDIQEAFNAGAPPKQVAEQMDKLRALRYVLKQGPEKRITANEVAQMQDDLELAARAREGVARPGTGRARTAPSAGRTPVEELEATTSSIAERGEQLALDHAEKLAELQKTISKLETLGPASKADLEDARTALRRAELVSPLVQVAKAASKLPSMIKSLAFGLDADADLRHLPTEFIRRVKAGLRWIDQAASDYNQLLREQDYNKQIDYLVGKPVKKANGQRYLTSGYDAIASMAERISGKVARLEFPEEFIRIMEKISNEGSGWIAKLPEAEQLKTNGMIHEFWAGDTFLDEVFSSIVGRFASAPGTRAINPPDLEILESILYHSGVTARQGKSFTGSSRQAIDGMMRKISGTKGALKADVFGQILAVSASADEAMRAWTRSGVTISADVQKAFGDYLMGKVITDPALRAKVQEVAERTGLGASFTALEGIGTTKSFIPSAVRERMVEALGRTLPRGRNLKPGSGETIFTAPLRTVIQLEKAIVTRGNIVTRARYFMYNSFDRFGQLALEVGLGPAFLTWVRQAAIDLTAIPGVENALRTGISHDVIHGARGEAARDVLQEGGDRMASALGRLFGSSGQRIVVNQIMDATDDIIMAGDKTYTAKVLNRIFVEEGAGSAFDNTQLRSIIQNRRNVGGLGPLDPSIASDVAESVSVRERFGAAATLVELGYEPRKAIQFVNKAYFDYATSVAKGESTGTASGLMLQFLDPYLAYTKNATRQIFNALMTPEAAYRMAMVRRIMDEGPAMLTEELYNLETDMYGVDVDAIPEALRDDYFVMKSELMREYDGDVPEDVRRAVRTIMQGGNIAYEGGRLRELTAGYGIRDFVQHSDFQAMRQAVPPRPDRSGDPTWIRGRPTFQITMDMETKAVKEYMNSQPAGSRSVLALVLPEDTIHLGMKRMMFTALVTVAVFDPDIPMEGVSKFAGDYFSPERSPVIGPLLGSAAGASGVDQRISATMARMLQDEFPSLHIQETTYGAGSAAVTVYKLPPGWAWRQAWLHSGLKDVDETLKAIEGNPGLTAMEKKGMFYRALSAATGIPIKEINRSRSAGLDQYHNLETLKHHQK